MIYLSFFYRLVQQVTPSNFVSPQNKKMNWMIVINPVFVRDVCITAIDLIRRLLRVDMNSRLSVLQAYTHKWIKEVWIYSSLEKLHLSLPYNDGTSFQTVTCFEC